MKVLFIKSIKIALVCFCLFFPLVKEPKTSLAYMSSANYINWMDSFNVGGEETSSSASYQIQDTLGELGTGPISSASYANQGGFRQVEANPILTFSISDNTIDLGTLDTGSVNSDSHTITTTTNSANGYTTTIVEDGNLRSGANDMDDVADGAVTAGSEEYGIRTLGAQGQMNGADTAITSTAQTVASYGSSINASVTTITYRVAISASTAAGTYSHTVTFISTGNF
jgi:hypothetical protein